VKVLESPILKRFFIEVNLEQSKLKNVEIKNAEVRKSRSKIVERRVKNIEFKTKKREQRIVLGFSFIVQHSEFLVLSSFALIF
jgi:hypothetical protein